MHAISKNMLKLSSLFQSSNWTATISSLYLVKTKLSLILYLTHIVSNSPTVFVQHRLKATTKLLGLAYQCRVAVNFTKIQITDSVKHMTTGYCGLKENICSCYNWLSSSLALMYVLNRKLFTRVKLPSILALRSIYPTKTQ